MRGKDYLQLQKLVHTNEATRPNAPKGSRYFRPNLSKTGPVIVLVNINAEVIEIRASLKSAKEEEESKDAEDPAYSALGIATKLVFKKVRLENSSRIEETGCWE